jgi:AcrR family transcriptional regulator
MVASSTRAQLIEAALQTLAQEGIAGTSARAIARTAEVNQALVFYHFDSVEGLLAAASQEASRRRAEVYSRRLQDVGSFAELADVARGLHAEERANGNLAVLAQLLAGARTHPALAPALRESFTLLADQVSRTLDRLLDGSALEGLVDPAELGRSIAAGFIGIELLDALSPTDDAGLFAALDTLAGLADAVAEISAVERRLVRLRLRSLLGPSAGGR